MAEKKKIINKWRHKYRLIFYNDNTFEEVWHIRLSKLNLLSVIGTLSILLITITSIFIAFTPLREFIPGYPSKDLRRELVLNVLRLDSLENELRMRDQYFRNLNLLISGYDPDDFLNEMDTASAYKDIQFTKSEQDSLLRVQIEEEGHFTTVLLSDRRNVSNISGLHFFPPVKGVVTYGYNATESHFGTDVVAAPNEVVKATLDGTVTLATWTLETGYIIQVQHDHNIISVYKHNASLLKKPGSLVKAGEAIAIVGNSGELTTGPHLHFELWHNGRPVNAEDFIIF